MTLVGWTTSRAALNRRVQCLCLSRVLSSHRPLRTTADKSQLVGSLQWSLSEDFYWSRTTASLPLRPHTHSASHQERSRVEMEEAVQDNVDVLDEPAPITVSELKEIEASECGSGL